MTSTHALHAETPARTAPSVAQHAPTGALVAAQQAATTGSLVFNPTPLPIQQVSTHADGAAALSFTPAAGSHAFEASAHPTPAALQQPFSQAAAGSSPPADSTKCQALPKKTGLLQSVEQASAHCSSMDIDPQLSGAEDEMLSSASSTRTAGPRTTSDNFVLPQNDTSGHLAISADGAAAAAPGQLAATASQPTGVPQPSSAPPPAAQPAGNTHAPSSGPASQASAKGSDAQGAAASESSTTPSLNQRLTELLKLQQAKPASANPEAASAMSDGASHGVPSHTSRVAQCLIVDGSKFAADSADAKQLATALALPESDTAALKQHLVQWLTALPAAAEIAIAYCKNKQVHVNFVSEKALTAALIAVPQLVRCGSAVTNSWPKPAVCCMPKHSLRELLHFSCTPTAPGAGASLPGEVEQLLRTGMQLSYTSFWFRSGFDANKADRIVFSVLPRDIRFEALKTFVEQMHDKFQLWGGRLTIHAPNLPELSRCQSCRQLGHPASACSKYRGCGVRLLYKQPVSYQHMLDMQQRTGAKSAYLSHSVDCYQPHRKLTLVFEHESDEKFMEVMAAIVQHIAAERPFLHTEPSTVRPQDRQRECKECSTIGTHACAFDIKPIPRSNTSAAAGTQQGRAGSANKKSSDSSSASPAPPPDRMCLSWRRVKVCPRKEQGRPCSFEHPEEHVPARKPCFQFEQKGVCNRAHCKFSHDQQPQQQQQPPTPAATAPAEVRQQAPLGSESASAMQEPPTGRTTPASAATRSHRQSGAAAADTAAAGSAVMDGSSSWSAAAEEEKESHMPAHTTQAAPTSVPPAATSAPAAPTTPASKGSKRKNNSGASNSAAAAAATAASSSNPFAALSDDDDDLSKAPPPSSLSSLSISSVGSPAKKQRKQNPTQHAAAATTTTAKGPTRTSSAVRGTSGSASFSS